MKKASNTFRDKPAFSLAEVLVALTIGAMVLVAVLSIYSRVETSAAAVTRKMDSSRLPSEILQYIVEDIDRTVTPGNDTSITIENKFENGFPTARLTILKTIYNNKNEKQTFEKIVWQANYNDDANGLILYRSYSGIALEDKLLDENKEDWERELFVPICAGVTFFKIQVPMGEVFQDNWAGNSLPHGIVVTISFAGPFKTLDGTLDVPENEKVARHMAVDKTRAIKFELVKEEDEEQQGDVEQEPE